MSQSDSQSFTQEKSISTDALPINQNEPGLAATRQSLNEYNNHNPTQKRFHDEMTEYDLTGQALQRQYEKEQATKRRLVESGQKLILITFIILYYFIILKILKYINFLYFLILFYSRMKKELVKIFF